MTKNKGLIALSMGGFGIGMTEFVMMGLLPDIAHSFGTTIPQAGHLISLYALGVVVGAPLIAAYSGKFSPNRILVSLMVFFTLAHLVSAFAPTHGFLLLARFVSGLPHGAYFGVGAVAASRMATKGKAAQAVAMMFAGLTVANVVGVPLGTYLGHTFNWRIVMVLIAAVGLATALALRSWLPPLAANSTANLHDDLKIFGRADTWFAIFITSIGTGGFFAWFSYISPLATRVAGFSTTAVTGILVVAGLGMTLGNSVGGYLADKYSPLKAIVLLMFLMSVNLLVMSLIAPYPAPFVLMTFMIGMTSFAAVAPIQMLIIGATQGSEILGSSLGQAGFNVGNALGAFLGGLPLVFGYGYTSPQVVGSGLALGGCLIALTMQRYGNSRAARAVIRSSNLES